MSDKRLLEERNILLQSQNGGKIIVNTTPALILQDAKTAELVRAETLKEVQHYIDESNIYQVEFEHYEGIKWIPLKTKGVILEEVIE